MAIAFATENSDGYVKVYDEKGSSLPFPAVAVADGLVGWSDDTVSVRSGAYVHTYNSDGQKIAATPAVPSPGLRGLERSADPDDPAEGEFAVWQSDGTGTGSDGDIMIKVTAAGVTNTRCVVGQQAVVVTDAATYTALASNSGKRHIIPDLTADCVITLPTAVAGLEFEWWYGGVAADAHDWQFDTTSDTNFYLGGLMQINDDDSNVRQAPNGSSNSIVNVLTPDVGTVVKMYCDGTNWYLSGSVCSATADAVTWADQS